MKGHFLQTGRHGGWKEGEGRARRAKGIQLHFFNGLKVDLKRHFLFVKLFFSLPFVAAMLFLAMAWYASINHSAMKSCLENIVAITSGGKTIHGYQKHG
ncbi:MAG: hypothetical protein H7Y31_07030 [Chitinophagaceae bacterium]|nr:hypothetical protein [Chitinophagaceae bacterium]